MVTRRTLTLGAGLALASQDLAQAQTPVETAQPAAAIRVKVPFVTDRESLPKSDERMFGPDFPVGGGLVRGTIEAELRGGTWVALPGTLITTALSTADREVSDADLSATIERGDPASAIIDEFLRVGPRAMDLDTGEARKLFFIHGYRNAFADSITSSAQLAHDHGIRDILCFSWPTQNQFLGYWHDQTNAPRAGADLSMLFGRLLSRLQAIESLRPRVDLVVHSMGNQVLSFATQSIGRVKPEILNKRLLGLTLLCAADEDHRALSEPYKLKSLANISESVSVYTNENDSALSLSEGIHFGIARLGAFGPYQFEKSPGNVFWIDCTFILTAEGHGSSHDYFRTSPAVRRDIQQVLAGNDQSKIEPRTKTSVPRAYVVPFDTTTEHAKLRGY